MRRKLILTLLFFVLMASLIMTAGQAMAQEEFRVTLILDHTGKVKDVEWVIYLKDNTRKEVTKKTLSTLKGKIRIIESIQVLIGDGLDPCIKQYGQTWCW